MNTLDILDVLAWVNIIEAIMMIYLGIKSMVRERRDGFHWIWVFVTLVGGIWFALYTFDVIGAPFTMHMLMGSGLIRAGITTTLGVLIGVVLQFQVPRHT